MQSQPQRGASRWRRFLRHNRQFFFIAFLMVIVVAVVAVLFWVMTSPRFVKAH